MKTDLSKLNEMQKEAVLYNDGPLAVLSVAGSGKTLSMTKKIEYLVRDLEVRPGAIWACTFTNKAANELKERLGSALGEDIKTMHIATLHKTAYKIYKNLKQQLDTSWKAPSIMVNNFPIFFPLLAYAKKEKFHNLDIHGYLREVQNMKLALIPLDKCHTVFPTEPGDERGYNIAVYKIYAKYQAYLKATSQMDFTDILVNCHNTMKDPKYKSALKRLSSKIEYLIVDESQDTNLVSFRIINMLVDSGDIKITIVGDLRQLIYSFQGANLEHVTAFIEKHDPKIIDLNINYRSTNKIVQSANALISTAKGIMGKPAITPNAEGGSVKYMTSFNSEEEGNNVYDLITQLVDGGVAYRDIAILYRVHSQSREVEDQLLLNDVPFIIQKNAHFFTRKEVKDVIAYVSIVKDLLKDNEIKLVDVKRIANRPNRFLSNKAIGLVEDHCFHADLSLWDGLTNIYDVEGLSSWERKACSALHSSINDLYGMAKAGATTYDIIDFVLEEQGYLEWARKEISERMPDQDVTLNLDALLTCVKKFPSPIQFLKFVAETLDEDKERSLADETGDFIKMMTIHSSKGREFEHVIILGVCNRLYPFYKADTHEGREEEKRIMYVAQTRPKKELYMSVIHGKLGKINVVPSPYLRLMNIGYNGGSNV